MSGRHRQRSVIIDSSSSEDEEAVVVMNNNRSTNMVGTSEWNDDASDSSSSLEGYLRSLRVTDKPPEPENIQVAEQQEDVNSDLDDSSSGESVEFEDDEEQMDEESVVVELPPTREEEEQAGIDVDSSFSLDRSTNEVYLSSDKAKNGVQWPTFRVPVPLWVRLYDYQKTGVSWMAGLHVNRVGGILGDDMGMVRCGACDPRFFSCIE
jgi:SNF2 family DNA or RNA helicase